MISEPFAGEHPWNLDHDASVSDGRRILFFPLYQPCRRGGVHELVDFLQLPSFLLLFMTAYPFLWFLHFFSIHVATCLSCLLCRYPANYTACYSASFVLLCFLSSLKIGTK